MTKRPVASLVRAVALCAVSLVGAPHPGGAQTAGPLRVEWESRQVGSGRAVVSGYVYNQNLMRVEHIRLRVEALDASSQPSSTRFAHVPGTIPSEGRGYFEVRVPAADAAYRVTVDSFGWSGCGDG